jgi:hypothetical protein
MSDGFYRIVVPTDFSTCSHEAWALAPRLACAFGSELIPVHVAVENPLGGRGPVQHGRGARGVRVSLRGRGGDNGHARACPHGAPPGQDLLLDMIRDPQFGPLVVVGFGGIYVEVL